MVKLKYRGESIQPGTTGAVEIEYVIDGATTREQAMAQLLAATAEQIVDPNFGTLRREKVPAVDEVSAEAGFWIGTVRWVADELSGQTQFEPTTSFNTTGGTAHITTSKATASATLDSAFDGTPNFRGAIGVTGDGDVEGTEIVAPVYEWEETHELPAATVTQAYRRNLFKLTGTVCSTAFRDFAIGEALFLGASGSRRGRGAGRPWEVNFKFAGSANVEGITIDGLGPLPKKGWEYLWVYYLQEESAKRVLPRPAGIFVEQVYDYVPWASLAIGSDPP